MRKKKSNSFFKNLSSKIKGPISPKCFWGIFALFIFAILILRGQYFLHCLEEMSKFSPDVFLEEPILPRLSFERLEEDLLLYNADNPIEVNGNLVSWEELENAIRYDQEIWRIKGYGTEEERQILLDRLIERKLVEQIAQENGIPEPTKEELERAKHELFGKDYDFSRVSSYPEFDAQLRTRALKNKMEDLLVKTYTGALIYVKFLSPGASQMESEGKDPRIEAREKIEEFHQKAKDGLPLSELVSLANNDPEIMKLNDEAKMEEFEDTKLQDLRLPSPEFKQELKTLSQGQLSNIIVLRAIMRSNQSELEEFAFGFVKTEKVEGGGIENLEDLIDSMKQKAEINIEI